MKRDEPFTVRHLVEIGNVRFLIHYRVLAEQVILVERERRHRGGRWKFDPDWTPEKGPPPPWLAPTIQTVLERHESDPGLAMRMATAEQAVKEATTCA